MFQTRMTELRRRLDLAGVDVALITDDDSVYYYTGYYDYLHMEFGRPTILVVPRDGRRLFNLAPIVSDMRMIKSPAELQLARHAGQVAMAMMDAARATIGNGVPEYEVALATTVAGTRKAAALLADH